MDKDLASFVEELNNHPIRKNLQASAPHGHPNDIYDMPSLHGQCVVVEPPNKGHIGINHCREVGSIVLLWEINIVKCPL